MLDPGRFQYMTSESVLALLTTSINKGTLNLLFNPISFLITYWEETTYYLPYESYGSILDPGMFRHLTSESELPLITTKIREGTLNPLFNPISFSISHGEDRQHYLPYES